MEWFPVPNNANCLEQNKTNKVHSIDYTYTARSVSPSIIIPSRSNSTLHNYMGGAASVKSEGEVRTMNPAGLEAYALESGMSSFVAGTIKTHEISGDFAYELDDETIGEIAGNSLLQKKKLLSAVGKLPRGGGGADSVESMANAAEELEGEARDLFGRYDSNDDTYLDQGEFTVLLSNEFRIPPDDVAPVFDEFDDDHDGKISFAEFVRHHNALVERQQRRTRGGVVSATQAVKTGQTLAGMFPKGKRIAVVFACDDYTGSEHDGKNLDNLKCAVKDAELFRDNHLAVKGAFVRGQEHSPIERFLL